MRMRREERVSVEEGEEVGGRRPNSNLVSARMTPRDSACSAALAVWGIDFASQSCS